MTKKIDSRFIIYEGFENEIEDLSEPILKKFNFKVEKISDSGFDMVNDKCRLSFSSEGNLIIWYYSTEYESGILLNQLFYDKYPNYYVELKEIVFSKKNSELFKDLFNFLLKYFSKELEEER